MASLAGWGTDRPEGDQARGSRSLDRLLDEQEGHLSHSGHSLSRTSLSEPPGPCLIMVVDGSASGAGF